MAWTRIDDKFLMNPKIQSAGAYGMALYLSGLIYSNTNLTDGYIPDVMLPALCGLAYQTPSKRVASLLVDLNLWERVSGGYQIHDFLTFNKSKQEIDLLNKQRAENGAKGGRPAKQTETGLLTETLTGLLSKQPPINPNTLIPLYPNELKDSTTTDLSAPENLVDSIYRAYKRDIGEMTPAVIDDILAVIDDYPADWFEESFKEAARNNKQSWSYALAILKRWKVDGYKVDTRLRKSNNGRKSTKPLSAGLDEILADAPIFAEDK